MGIHLYRRMRRYPERLRHSRRAKPGQPSAASFLVTRSPNVDAIYAVAFSIDDGALAGQNSTTVDAGTDAVTAATAIATAWNGNAALTVTNPSDGVIAVAATTGTLTSVRCDTLDTTSSQ